MKRSIAYSIIYQLIFAFLSLSLTAILEGYRGEIFAGIFWFNITYGLVGLVTNTSSIYFAESIFKEFPSLITFQSIVVITVINGLFYYMDRSFVTLSLFTAEGDQLTVSIFTHGLIFASLYGSGLFYKRSLQKSKNTRPS